MSSKWIQRRLQIPCYVDIIYLSETLSRLSMYMFDFNLRYITWCGSWGQHNYGSTQTTYYQNLFTSNNLSENLLENTTSPFLTTALLTNSYRKLGLSYIYFTSKYFLYAKYQDKTIFWYSENGNGQFNNSFTYDYCAIGD